MLEKSSLFRGAVFVRSTDDRMAVLVRCRRPPPPHYRGDPQGSARAERRATAEEQPVEEEEDPEQPLLEQGEEEEEEEEQQEQQPLPPGLDGADAQRAAIEGRAGRTGGVPSLQVMCEQQLSKAISLRNLGAIFNAALFLRLPELSKYCSDFVLA